MEIFWTFLGDYEKILVWNTDTVMFKIWKIKPNSSLVW